MGVAIVNVWTYVVINTAGYNYRYSVDASAVISGWTRDTQTVQFRTLSPGSGVGVPIYQYSAPYFTGGADRYILTTDANLASPWTKMDVIFDAYTTQVTGTIPIYQYHCGTPARYLYTEDPNILPSTSWVKDSVAFYTYPRQPPTLPNYALKLNDGEKIVCRANVAYSFGFEDFSVTTLFRTSAVGSLVCRKPAGGMPGWTLVLLANGVFKFLTDNGQGYLYVSTAATKALNGQWHHVAAIRRGIDLEIWFDGVKQTVTATQTASSIPVNVGRLATPYQITFGNNDQVPSQFIGEMEDITIWNVALTQTSITNTMFNMVEGNEPGLVGYWPLDYNLTDKSATGCNGAGGFITKFVPIFNAKYVQGASNLYSFVSVTNQATSSKAGDTATASRTQVITVSNGAPTLVIGLSSMTITTFPIGCILTVRDPAGNIYSGPQNTPTTYVSVVGSSIYQMVIKNPAPGDWTTTITAPLNIPFHLCLSTIPSKDIIPTMQLSLIPIYKFDESTGDILDAPVLGGRIRLVGGFLKSVLLAVALVGMTIVTGVLLVLQPELPIVGQYGVAYALAIDIGLAKEFVDSLDEITVTTDSTELAVLVTGGTNPVLDKLFALIWGKVAVQVTIDGKTVSRATTDMSLFMDRRSMAINDDYNLHLDIGGEGFNTNSGFSDSINVNIHANTTYQVVGADGSYGTRPIPYNIILQDWTKKIPLKDATINYITLQSFNLTDFMVSEISRLLVPGGKVGLWLDPSYYPLVQKLATLLNTTVKFSCSGVLGATVCGVDCIDEFNGLYSGAPIYIKMCLTNQRVSVSPKQQLVEEEEKDNDWILPAIESSPMPSDQMPSNNQNSSSSLLPGQDTPNPDYDDNSIVGDTPTPQPDDDDGQEKDERRASIIQRMRNGFDSLTDDDIQFIVQQRQLLQNIK
ncbi:hypothetical protein DFA_05626 [Cavenderia fasciculata]|uniref:Laminin G domain-containing protein n=1 Tax=Cavenderia fasciculata TaxID=261658 RepID=F4PLS1_CACFS|nr:uncharacterized protein DFA_05626 [Cavenderia fasciculata]EGG23493.1 hypothetical protein DFA_05626 [Cavenderia fasciculata]|eukprot:XP_004361344.1 hypothetical protein DFA_05626 [Cavenderia fasciculata]